MLRLFIRARLPEFGLPLDNAEAVSVVSATSTEVLVAARRANAYLKTALPGDDTPLFSAAFVKLIYEQMIRTSQELNQTVLFKSEICAAIKAKIESAKTKDAVIDLFEFLNASIDAEEQWYSAETFKDIRNQIGRYVAIAHPHIPEQINAELAAVNAERNNALRESALYGAWSTLCAVNALGQSWMNVLWTASNVVLCIPLCFAASCLPELFHSYSDVFFPFERDAMSDDPKVKTPPVLVPIASTVKGCANMWSEGSKALEHHRKLRSHQQVVETCVMR